MTKQQQYNEQGRTMLTVSASLTIIGIMVWGVCWAVDQLPAGHLRRKTEGIAFQLKQFQVENGNEAVARKYYREKVSPHLQFLSPNTIENSSIKDLLDYFGYNITPQDLHQLTSDQLMQKSEEGDILAARFFAPKISDVSDRPAQIPAGGFGWRKLVRFKVKAGSKADENDMVALLFLQNNFEKTIEGNPFDANNNVSLFNQAIVVRERGLFTELTEEGKHSIYFLTYGPLVKIDGDNKPLKDQNGNFQDEGRLTLSLNATFDENDRNPETNRPPKEYFVPDSCVQCHGGTSFQGKANYLDTDHWFDRVTPNYGVDEEKFKQEDFTALAQSPYGILFDGGKDIASDRFRKAFDTIRKLNEEIKDQNAVLGEAENFQLGAVRRWLDLHKPDAFGDSHVAPFERGYGDQKWDPSNNNHRRMLYFLNRYCYRCHSSVAYNVFDREAVKERVGSISRRLLEINRSDKWMPQDRIFPGLAVNSGTPEATGDLKEFLCLLSQLADPTGTAKPCIPPS